jgi:hypothetical protein
MGSLYEVEIEPEVRRWLEALSDWDFGRVHFLVGLLAEHAEDLGEGSRMHAISAERSGNCVSIYCGSRLGSPTRWLRAEVIGW